MVLRKLFPGLILLSGRAHLRESAEHQLNLARMKLADSTISTVGGAASVALPHTSDAALNVEEYASSPPQGARTGFPKRGGQSLSYWLQQVRCDPLLDHRTTETLPKEADTVIIGSGISGTLVAKHHLATWPSKSVVVLEAREFCSGATGRNAGHCKPDQWRHFAKFEKAYGQEQAVKIMDNEGATWKALVAYVKENNVDCDLWVGDTLDVPVDEEVAKVAKEVFERYRDAGGKVDHIKVTHDPLEAAKISRIKSAKACYAWTASTLQPWKLTAHVMRENIEGGTNLQTHTMAKSITKAETGSRKWTVHTDRGEIVCDTVVHATNGYSAALEPSLQGLITPKPHICNRFIPPRALCGTRALKNSYGVLLPDGALFSINSRCSSDGNVMFGGSNPGQKQLDEWAKQNSERCVDDSLANLELVTKEVRSFVESEFLNEGEAEYGPGEGFQYSWSGIIGLSTDGVPFVGGLPDKPGQWICAGHHGQ
jgi:glycine/D-amino acid oxidase-like deaminating enzyme